MPAFALGDARPSSTRMSWWWLVGSWPLTRTRRRGLLPAYTEAMQALVFKPLGMKSTTFDFKRVARADHAAPHPLDVHGEAIAVTVNAERWTLPVSLLRTEARNPLRVL